MGWQCNIIFTPSVYKKMHFFLQFHGSTSISILQRLIEILFMQKNNPSNKPQRSIVPNRRIRKPFFNTRDRRFLQQNNDKLTRNWNNWREIDEIVTFESGDEK